MAIDPITGQEVQGTTQGTPEMTDKYAGLTSFEKELAGLIENPTDPNAQFFTQATNLLSQKRQQANPIIDQTYKTLQQAFKAGRAINTDLWGGYRAVGGDRGTPYQLLDKQGNVIYQTNRQIDFVNQARFEIAKKEGYDLPTSGQGTWGFLSSAFTNVANKLGLGTTNLKEFKAQDYAQKVTAKEGNYGTFINAAGKQVVATTPETLKSMKALGFRQVAQGTTQLTPEQQTMVQEGRQQVEQQIQQALASGQIDAATAQKLMAGQQEGDVGAGIQTPTQPVQGTQVQMAGMPMTGTTQQATPQMQVNSSTGEITLASGQRISPQDPNYQQYLSQLPTAQGLPSGTQLATGQVQAQPADQQLASQVQQAMSTNGASKANVDYVNAVFKAYHNRNATQEELARYSNMTVSQAGQEIIGGAPQPFTQEEAGLISSGQFQRIESPEQLTQLAMQYGLGEKDIVRIGNKLFAPANLKVNVDGVLDGSSIANREYTGLENASDLDSDKITSAANDYLDQYISQISPEFAATRQAYWKSLLSQTDFRERTLERLQNEYELDEISDKLTELDLKIAAENQAWRTLEEENRNQPISITAILGREAHIKRMASIRMEGLLGQREALAGDYDRAMKHIEQAYTAAVGDYEENVDNLKSWYEEQKEFFDTQEKRAYEAKIKQAEQEFELYKDNLASMKDLMLKYPTAGISFNDPYDVAIQKAGQAYLQELSLEYAKGSYTIESYNGQDIIFDKSSGKIISGVDIAGSFSNPMYNYQLPKVQQQTSSAIGEGVITAYGSPYWDKGLDFVLSGGKGATVASPVSGEIVQVDTGHKTGEQNSFGNRVKIKLNNGEELWFSHLDSTSVKVGQTIDAGTIIGTQGNTGSVIPSAGGDGTHLDITWKKADGSFYSAQDVAVKLGIGNKELSTQAVQSKQTLDLLSGILDHKGMGESVGVKIKWFPDLSRWDWNPLDGQKQSFIGNVNMLIDQKTLDTLLNLKKAGGTLGALSDSERIMLRSAATQIGTWEIRDKNNKVIGYDVGEKEFKQEVNKILTLAQTAMREAGFGDLVDANQSTADILSQFNIK